MLVTTMYEGQSEKDCKESLRNRYDEISKKVSPMGLKIVTEFEEGYEYCGERGGRHLAVFTPNVPDKWEYFNKLLEFERSL